MKTLITLTIILVTLGAQAQTASDIFKKTSYDYTYLGIDYSHAKFLGDFNQFSEWGDVGFVRLKEEYFSRWNNVIRNESDKYSWEEALRKEYVDYNLQSVREINDAAAVEEMEAAEAVKFDQSMIQEWINGYEFNVKKGVGIFLVCEYLDKKREEACFHFVALNLESKEILLYERFVEAAGGFGLRNYWVRPVYEVIDRIKSFRYNKWKRDYKQTMSLVDQGSSFVVYTRTFLDSFFEGSSIIHQNK